MGESFFTFCKLTAWLKKKKKKKESLCYHQFIYVTARHAPQINSICLRQSYVQTSIYTAAGAQGRLCLMPQWHIHYFELKLLDKQPVGKKFI